MGYRVAAAFFVTEWNLIRSNGQIKNDDDVENSSVRKVMKEYICLAGRHEIFWEIWESSVKQKYKRAE